MRVLVIGVLAVVMLVVCAQVLISCIMQYTVNLETLIVKYIFYPVRMRGR